ncbi:hypothetical protein [Prevotella sp. SGI.167]|uniref:hypothetical protein n=1 Tax=Prevotella sp. SGI.167 TaxID=3420566 RepID=UPI004040A644
MPPKLLYKKSFDSREFLGWVNRYAKRKDFSNSRMINMGAYTVDTDSHVLGFRGCSEKTLGNTELLHSSRKMLNNNNLKEFIF